MHTDPEILALVALGEREAATPTDLDHIAHCAACERELAELGHLSQVGRTISDHVTLETPDPLVWDRIRAQLGFSDNFTSDLVPPRASPATPPVALAASSDVARESTPERIDRPSPRRRRLLSLALAAVLALLAGIGGTLAWQQLRPLTETVVASTTLEALPKWAGASGEATLEEDPAGTKVLVVSMVTPRPVDGIQQVWLIDRDQSSMLQVGWLTAPIERFRLPADLDISRYPIVDISVEPPDGNLQHSGDSIVRGTLDV
jgi:hypothetical protein